MAGSTTVDQLADEVITYGIDFAAACLVDGAEVRSLVSATASAATGLTIGAASVAGTVASATVSGGTAATTYTCKMHATFSDGDQRTYLWDVRISTATV